MRGRNVTYGGWVWRAIDWNNSNNNTDTITYYHKQINSMSNEWYDKWREYRLHSEEVWHSVLTAQPCSNLKNVWTGLID